MKLCNPNAGPQSYLVHRATRLHPLLSQGNEVTPLNIYTFKKASVRCTVYSVRRKTMELCNPPMWDLNLTWYTEQPDFTPCFHKVTK